MNKLLVGVGLSLVFAVMPAQASNDAFSALNSQRLYMARAVTRPVEPRAPSVQVPLAAKTKIAVNRLKTSDKHHGFFDALSK
jgi:hypothetical protein